MQAKNQIVESTLGPVTFRKVVSWQTPFHGFVGRDVDIRYSLDAWKLWLRESFPDCGLIAIKPRLVHGTDFIFVEDSKSKDVAALLDGELREADAWIVDFSCESLLNFSFGISTADCFPVIALDRRRRLAALIHCGWRGSVNGILLRVLDAMIDRGADNLELAIGPGAQVQQYEIGEDVADEFRRAMADLRKDGREKGKGLNLEDVAVESRNGRHYANIPNLLISQAISRGLDVTQIYVSSECTMSSKKFYSHRREKHDSGRQLSFIGPWELL